MSKKYLQIQIPTPCSEDFSKMTPVEKGHYCSSCEKVVIDFSKMSDREIVDFYKKNKGKFCGQFHKSQLNRSIRMTPPKVNSFFGKAAGLLLTGVLSAGASNIAAQSIAFNSPDLSIEMGNDRSSSAQAEEKVDRSNGRILRMNIIGKGLIHLEENNPIQGANVNLRGSDIVEISDSLGIVEFFLPEELLQKKKLIFDVSHPIYKNKKVKIKTKRIKRLTSINVQLQDAFFNFRYGYVVATESNSPFGNLSSFPSGNSSLNDNKKVKLFDFEKEINEELAMDQDKSIPPPVPKERTTTFPPLGVAIKKVYPNPFIDEINLEISTEQEGNIKIQLVDISGQVVFQKEKFIDRGTKEYKFYLGNLSLVGNLFILQVQDESGQMQSQQMMRFTNHGFTFR